MTKRPSSGGRLSEALARKEAKKETQVAGAAPQSAPPVRKPFKRRKKAEHENRTVQTTVPYNTYAALDRIAYAQGRHLRNIVREALLDILEKGGESKAELEAMIAQLEPSDTLEGEQAAA